MANTKKYLPEQVTSYRTRINRINKAVENSKFKTYISLACLDNPCLTPKMVSNVVHNSKWLHAEEVLTTLEKVLKIPSLTPKPVYA